MKLNLALPTGAIVLAPAIALASQAAQTPAGQGATQTQGASDTQSPATSPKGAGDAVSSCDTTNKSASSDAKTAHPSAKVGKDTGDPPPPRKKAPKNGTCATQPQ